MFISGTKENILTLKMIVVIFRQIMCFVVLEIKSCKFVMNVCIKSYHPQFSIWKASAKFLMKIVLYIELANTVIK